MTDGRVKDGFIECATVDDLAPPADYGFHCWKPNCVTVERPDRRPEYSSSKRSVLYVGIYDLASGTDGPNFGRALNHLYDLLGVQTRRDPFAK